MAVAAYLALALAGELPATALVAGAVGIVASWFWEPPRVRPERWTAVWNALAIGAFGYTLLAALSGGEWVISGADFLVFLLVAKLFTRRSSRDYQWIYVITFLMLVAGTTLNAEASYALCFLGYVVFATWALTLFHLRREMEENFLLKHSDDSSSERVEVERILSSRRIVGRDFLVATSSVSLAIFVLSSVLFFLFPRVGFGLFLQRGKGHLTFAGFSDGVTLGGHGLIRNDETVVMRVKIDDARFQGAAAPELHWRGVAFDRYAGGKWSRSPNAFGTRAKTRTLPDRTQVILDGAARLPGGLAAATRQEIYVEPLDTFTLFAASTPVAVELEHVMSGMMGRLGQNDEIRFPHYAGLRYVAYSDVTPPDRAVLAAAGDANARLFAAYLALPPELPERVVELGRRVTAGKVGPLAKTEAVAAYLRDGYGYTLEMDTDDKAEPLDHFLFERKRGHCEYFSSAMAVLLRAAGVPTRNVDGFLGGEWNEYGRYIAVRGGDAHSWVEVWFDGVGWVTWDPTPTAADDVLGRGGGSLGDRLRRMLDTVRLTWLKWVIEYDLGRQMGLLRALGDTLGLGPDSKVDRKALSAWLGGHRRLLALLAAAALLGLGAALWWRRRRARAGARPRASGPRRPDHAAVHLWTRSARVLATRGFPRPPSATPREHAADLARRGAPGATAFAALTELYYTARYAEAPALVDAVDLDEARRLAAEVKAARPLPK
jgi:transglutaminase-like putative cysteine protease